MKGRRLLHYPHSIPVSKLTIIHCARNPMTGVSTLMKALISAQQAASQVRTRVLVFASDQWMKTDYSGWQRVGDDLTIVRQLSLRGAYVTGPLQSPLATMVREKPDGG